MSILGTIKNKAALIKLEIRSGGDAREYHQIDMKETLITLGYAQHSDKLRYSPPSERRASREKREWPSRRAALFELKCSRW